MRLYSSRRSLNCKQPFVLLIKVGDILIVGSGHGGEDLDEEIIVVESSERRSYI